MKLILLGAPGAGKGTQAEFISEAFSIPTISTGNILRAAIQAESPVGLRAKTLVEAGQLVPDDVILEIVAQRVQEEDCQGGYILDGMPRTIPQAEGLEKIGVEIDAALYLEVPDAVIEQRMTGRRTCPKCGATYHLVANPPKQAGICNACGTALTQRKDDLPETVQSRLSIYHRETEPLLAYYQARGKLKTVSGVHSLEETRKLVLEALEMFK